MTNWDARAQSLLAHARGNDRAPAGTRARVKASVAASVALSATAGATATILSSHTALAKLPAAVKAASGLLPAASYVTASSGPVLFLAPVTVGVAIGLAAITPSQVTPKAPVAAVAAQAPQSTKVLNRLPVSTAPRAWTAPAEVVAKDAPASPVVSSKPVAPSLSEESSLLEHARLVLRQGDAELALRLLDRHRAEFPNGVLFFEALATRSVALCKLGQTEAALQVLSRLDATTSNRGLVARVRSACGLPAMTDALGEKQ